MEYKTGLLRNGIRLVHIAVDSKVAHFGVLINAGTRDELPGQSGIAHLTEHMLFKGTHKRKAYHILSRLDDVGGEFDAYTTKEDIALYTTFLNSYYNRSIELLSDVLFSSVLPEKELLKERDVICDEINSYRDNPAELVFDEFESYLFSNHALGNPILGDEASIRNISVCDIKTFMKRCFNTDQMVLCSAGNIPFNKLMHYCDKYFGEHPENLRGFQRAEFSQSQRFEKRKEIGSHQAHCMLGNTAYSYRDERRLALILLSNILAGPVMNSRLNLLLREKHGITYNIESSYNPYYETGNFSIYFGTDNDKVEKCLSLIRKELISLCNTPLGSMQLSKAKRQIMGQLAISTENHAQMMLSAAKSYLLFDDIESLPSLFDRIEQIKSSDITEVANEVCHPDKLSMLLFN